MLDKVGKATGQGVEEEVVQDREQGQVRGLLVGLLW